MERSRILGAVCAFVIGPWSAPLFAQPAQVVHPAPPADPRAETSAMTDKARALFIEGQKAMVNGRWSEAHAAFLAAWSLKRQYQIAGNLGAMEMKLGRYREAAEHLTYYVREAPTSKEKERLKAQGMLAEARKHVGALALKVEPAGADVLVDGRPVGKAPFADEVFVEAGARAIEVRLDGYVTAMTRVEIAAGGSREVALTLVKRERASGHDAFTGAVTSAGGTRPAGSEESAGHEYLRPAVNNGGGRSNGLIIAGIATSAVTVAVGIGFAVAASGEASEADEKVASLRQQTGEAYPCRKAVAAPGCDDIRELREGRDVLRDVAIWSFIGGGALAAGTVIYAVTGPKPNEKSSTQLLPVITNTGGALIVRTTW